jgi:hypothetical protein
VTPYFLNQDTKDIDSEVRGNVALSYKLRLEEGAFEPLPLELIRSRDRANNGLYS